MKRTILLTFASIMTIAVFAQKNAANPIKTETDTLSYTYGVALGQQGLKTHLIQSKIYSDTADVRLSYDSRIVSETDQNKIRELNKELEFKLDSINKANDHNLTDFFRGINESMNAGDKNSAYTEGIALGKQITHMINSLEGQLSNEGTKINTALFLSGIEDALKNKDIRIDDAFNVFNRKMGEKQAKAEAQNEDQKSRQYADYREQNTKFLEENKTKEGIHTLPSGLQYKIITQGSGELPAPTDKVKVHYTGTLIDGTVFDSSVERGEPIVFGLQQVIPGWTEGLQLMPVGSKWTLYIPYDLAYGTRETGPIKPYSTLIFEVELLDIEKE